MRSILDLFAKSPFRPVQSHMEKVRECVGQIGPLFDALLAGEDGKIPEISAAISRLEHEADSIKNGIRHHLPKSIFLPVDRGDLLILLGTQDSIADKCEDLGILLTMRSLKVPPELRDPLKTVVTRAVNVAVAAGKAVEELDNLVRASFGGPEAERVNSMINGLGSLEHECDKAQWELARKVFSIEDKISAGELWMFLKLGATLGDLANSAENVGKRLQMMLRI